MLPFSLGSDSNSSSKDALIAASRGAASAVAGLLQKATQGILHFPTVEHNESHKKFQTDITTFINDNPELKGDAIGNLISCIKDSPIFENLSDENKQIFASRFESIASKEELRKKELQAKMTELEGQSREIVQKDIDAQNSMWKWRLAQVVLLSCGICGVDILGPLLDIVDSMFFDPSVATPGQGLYDSASDQVPVLGDVSGGIGGLAADYTPIVADANQALHGLGTSDPGIVLKSIAGPLAQTQLTAIAASAAFLLNGLFEHELPHRQAINERQQALKNEAEGVKDDLIDESSRNKQKAATLLAKTSLEIGKLNTKRDHVASMIKADIDNNHFQARDLQILQDVDFLVEGKPKKLEKFTQEEKGNLFAAFQKGGDAAIAMLPEGGDGLDKIMKRVALHEELLTSPAYTNAADVERSQIFEKTLKKPRNPSDPDDLNIKSDGRCESEKTAIDRKIYEFLLGLLSTTEQEIENRLSSSQYNQMSEQQKLGTKIRFLENKATDKLSQDLIAGKNPLSTCCPKFSRRLSSNDLQQPFHI